MSAAHAMEYEDALSKVGEFGRFQKLMFFFGCAYSAGACICNFSYVFVAALPDHWCHVPELQVQNLTLEQVKQLSLPLVERDGEMVYSRCEMYDRPYGNQSMMSSLLSQQDNETAPVIGCQSGWSFDTSHHETSVSMDWDLTCERKVLAAVSQSVYMAGLMTGVMCLGLLADAIGRRKTIIICVCLNVTAAILTAFSVSFIMFAFLRFFIASSEMALFSIYIVLCVELVGAKWRVFVGIVSEYFWCVGYVVLVTLAYNIRQWRHLQLAFAVPLLCYFPILYFIPESPRWLYSKGRREEGDRLMREVAKTNDKTFPEDIRIMVTQPEKKVYIWQTCLYPKLRIRFAIVYFIWFVCSLVYYGLSLNSTNLGGNEYLNFLLSGAIEVPAYVFSHVALNRLGRRLTTAGTTLLGGVALLLTMAVPQEQGLEWILVALSTVGKFGISATFAIVYVYTVELFPTVVRSSGLGTASCFSRIGGIIAPQMALMGEYSKYVPLVTCGVLSFAAGLSVLALPETMNTQMPETLLEAENFGNKEKPKHRPVDDKLMNETELL